MAKLVSLRARPKNDRPIIELTGNGNLLCYEKCGGRWFRSHQYTVARDISTFDEMYDEGDVASLADLHDCLGITSTPKDHDYIWTRVDCGDSLLVETKLIENGFMGMDEPVLVIDPVIFPSKD